MKYKISQFARKNNVTIRTVWNWIANNKVNTERIEEFTVSLAKKVH